MNQSSEHLLSSPPGKHLGRRKYIVKKKDRGKPANPADKTFTPQQVMSESDLAYPIISTIVRIVPASRWSFAPVASTGDTVALLASDGNRDALSRLARDEYHLQRTKSPSGPRIAATLGPLNGFASGITLLFADARADFGILTLLRTRELGPFTSSEISMLTFALDAASDRLSALRLQPSAQANAMTPRRSEMNRASESPEGAFYVLDRDLQIVLAWSSEDQRRIALTGLHTRIAERLPVVLEETVRELTAGWFTGTINQPGIARPVPFLVVRTKPMSGPIGLFIGVHIDRFQAPNSLTGAASRFHISPREMQVLALLLDGNHLDQVAEQLHITSSTVQDHIKSMLGKTNSSNRSALIARVLGWESMPSALRA